MSSPISTAHNDVKACYAPVIYNVVLTVAGQEYSQALPVDCRKFSIRPRNLSHTIKLAFASGQSGSTYLSVDSMGFFEDMVGANDLTLYLQSSTAGAVVEIIAWS